MLIDTHAHLNEPRFVEDFSSVRDRARQAGVARLVNVGYDLPSSAKAVELAEQFGDRAAVGIHPHDASQWTSESPTTLRKWASSSSRVVALGETGLDYHYNNSPQEVQQQVFRAHIALGKELDLPLIMHCREAYGDLIRILEEENAGEIGGVAHCFFGTTEDAHKLVEMGFYLGVGGGVTFPKSEALRQTLLTVSRDRILLETDCPYMAPVPYRGKRNEPSYLTYVAERLAELYGVSRDQLEAETTANALRCFPKLTV
jgi:TatD DNase family protein